jgi:predicted enzyme related to lactoylglutathione lyase
MLGSRGDNIMTSIKSFTIGIPVSDMSKGIEWYRQLIGKVNEVEPAPGVWECEVMPSVWLQLFEQPISGTNPAVIRFESENVEASRGLAKRLSPDVGEIETVPGAVRYFEFRDPFGNQLSFYELVE